MSPRRGGRAAQRRRIAGSATRHSDVLIREAPVGAALITAEFVLHHYILHFVMVLHPYLLLLKKRPRSLRVGQALAPLESQKPS